MERRILYVGYHMKTQTWKSMFMPAACDRLIACAPRSLQSHVANLQSKSTGQGGGISRRARVRKAKSAFPKHHFSFQKRSLSREENALFYKISGLHEGEVETSSF